MCPRGDRLDAHKPVAVHEDDLFGEVYRRADVAGDEQQLLTERGCVPPGDLQGEPVSEDSSHRVGHRLAVVKGLNLSMNEVGVA